MIKKLALLAAAAGMLVVPLAGTASAQTAPRQPVKAEQVAPGKPGSVVRYTVTNGHRDYAGTSVSPRTALGCSVINIGQPGNIYYGGEYAGQVEQEYNTCNGQAFAHWQWAGGFQNSHPGAWVDVNIISYYGGQIGYGGAYTYTKDVPTGAVDIHSANPDAWHAQAIVNGCGSWAKGTEHWYGGQDWDGPHSGGC
ncbi:hypothetical protein [Streptomyces violascens]|uniref:Secreted protein n=1 Tax=Streptomyces violascens TaxID=67381 RepID=A0ABQ3QSQ5_9ACTN|nr:hypothetical protein [Streptomyces violascens]GGU33424.1 hypothetical protein GCM10010289_63370 [Streptomyces violascens]GHI40278.1 hypothetical protein Sviol_46860 [Streptomyces violascens]